MAAYLLILGDREALGWVLRTSAMAFPNMRRSEIDALSPGDHLFSYTTRGCFRNPGRDRGRVIGLATVASRVTPLSNPVHFAGREFARGCAIAHESLAPFGSGVELAPLIDELDAFLDSGRGWAMRLRRPLLQLSDRDAVVLASHLEGAAHRPPRTADIAAYARWFDTRGGDLTPPAGLVEVRAI